MNKEEFIEKYHSRIFYSEEAKRNPLARFGISCSDGWMDIVSKCAEEIVANDPEERVKFFQIKEKFGGLRFYVYGGDDYIQGMIDFAECISYSICEDCSQPGKPRYEGWARTLCDACFEEEDNG